MSPRILLPLLFVTLAHGQVYTPPSAPVKPPPSATPQDTAAAPAKQNTASPLGQEIPMLDPAAETITVGGVTIPLGDNRLVRARFEKFLSQPPESGPETLEYRKTIATILATVSPYHEGGPNLYEAFKLLPRASAYPGDANICGTLAEAVYNALLAKQGTASLTKDNAKMDQEKKSIISDADWAARHEKVPGVVPAAPAGGRSGGRTTAARGANPGAGTDSLKYADTLMRIAEIAAQKKLNVGQQVVQTVSTKTQYQANMALWFFQRRFEHVIMASRFYNRIWNDGKTDLFLDKNADVSKAFSQTVGMSPTVSSLDSIANEAVREADKYIEAFDSMLAAGELHSAAQRLQEAFAVGEYLAPVATLSLEKKRRILTYYRNLNEVYTTLQARDFTKARELVAQLKKSAKDFPSAKMDSAISGNTLASDLAIEEAKANLLARDSDKAAEKIRIATEIWPTNPKLDEFRDLSRKATGLVSIRADFDRLLGEGNFREIARRQYEIAPAIQGDEKREEAFKRIMTNLVKIEAAIGKAAEFGKIGQSYAAWEQLAELREQFPDDPKLGRELELLAPKVADLTKALDKAHQFESRTPQQTGSALSWYLKARSIYPQSKLADEGTKRLVREILPADDSTAPSAEARSENKASSSP